MWYLACNGLCPLLHLFHHKICSFAWGDIIQNLISAYLWTHREWCYPRHSEQEKQTLTWVLLKTNCRSFWKESKIIDLQPNGWSASTERVWNWGPSISLWWWTGGILCSSCSYIILCEREPTLSGLPALTMATSTVIPLCIHGVGQGEIWLMFAQQVILSIQLCRGYCSVGVP